MARAPYQVLVIPFDDTRDLRVAVLRPADAGDPGVRLCPAGEGGDTCPVP